MRSRFLVCLVLCLVGGAARAWAVSTSTGGAMHCRSKKYDFSMTVPGQWRKVSQQLMDMMKASIDPGDADYDFECIAAYGQDYVMGNPTSIIGVVVGYYKDKRQISKREIRQTVKVLTGADLKKLKRAARQAHRRDYNPPNIRNMKTRDVRYVDEKMCLIWDVDVEPQQGETGRMQLYSYFGREVMVMIVAVAPAGEFSKCAEALAGVDRTFRFEPGAEFQQTEWYRSNFFAIGLIAVATSLLAYTFRERKS
jgi:hypothetical protein